MVALTILIVPRGELSSGRSRGFNPPDPVRLIRSTRLDREIPRARIRHTNTTRSFTDTITLEISKSRGIS
jgi:hypothetical protein